MKKLLLIALLIVGWVFAQQYEDVVILKNGSEIHGIIIEEKPYEYIKIQSGKNTFVFQFDEIELLKKELINKIELEQKELELQFVKAFFIIILTLIFIEKYKLLAVVILYVVFMLFVNIIQLFYIYKRIKISPFSKELLNLILISFPLIWFSICQDYEFQFYHYFIIPIALYLFFGVIFAKRIKLTLKEIR